ncbi:hypothetical protein [Siminovitchia sp. 179-K 8D1 HS]|uniref:hypothetical protein n=1 Tax=Siminovitchia sp. 179-K 8D1 HS TaxID=3142385 RepID=UPI0039A38128
MKPDFIYVQKITKQSKGFVYGILFFLSLLTLACGIAAFWIFFFTSDPLIGLLPFVAGLIAFVALYFSFKQMKAQPLQTDVREIKDGAVHHVWKNDETGEMEETWVPFEEITAIYIARHSQVNVSGSNIWYSIYPKLIVEWEEDGSKKYISFIEAKKDAFYELYEQFPVDQIPVYTANIDLKMWPDHLLSKVFESEKARKVEQKRPLKLPFKARTLSSWSPPLPNIKGNEERKQADLRKFNVIGVITCTVGMIITFLSLLSVLPQWTIEDGVFTSDASLLFTLIYVLPLLTFFHARKKWNVRWLLVQMVAVASIYSLSGWIVTQMNQVSNEFTDALITEIFMACFMVFVSYLFGKLLVLFVVIHEKVDKKRK